MKILLLLAAFVALAASTPVEDKVFHYDGYQVIRTFPQTDVQYEALNQLEEHGFDFWSDLRRGKPTDIMVGPDQVKEFQETIQQYDIQHRVWIEDVEKIIEEQRIASAARTNANFWEDYQSLATINAFLKDLVRDYPNLISLEIIGQSYEERDLPLVKISTGESPTKQAVFIDGNIHAREWISPAVVTYIIYELVVNSDAHTDILALYDFYIVPNVNPDGYEFTRTQRLWRKTRADYDSPNGCVGTDANRNWDYNWGQPGASTEKCSDLYMGPKVFSEDETHAIQNFILETDAKWTLFLTIHSYGQYCLLPFGDGSRPADYDEMLEKGNIFAEAVNSTFGTKYSVGNSYDILYRTSGTSQDWAKGTANFKYSYTLELRDNGWYGFLLPPEQIIPTAIETWAGIQAMLRSNL